MEVGIDKEGNPYLRVPGFVALTFNKKQFIELVAQMAAIAAQLKKGG